MLSFQEAKHIQHAARHILPNEVLLMELTGHTGEYRFFSVFGGSICTLHEFKINAHSMEYLLVCNVMLSFWKDDFLAAEQNSNAAWNMPTAKE